MIKKARIILALLIAFSLNTSAQTFNAGICAGPVVTQYNGDNVGGYSKIGPKAGIFVHRDMPGKLNYQIDMIFVQKGSKYENTEAVDYYNLRLRYLELPITFQYITDVIEIPGLFRLQFPSDVGLELGLGAAYLLEAKDKKPRNPVVLQNLAVFYDRYRQNIKKALKYYRRCLQASMRVDDNERANKVRNRLRELAKERI